MHIGRSHHTGLQVLLAGLGGFVGSFLFFVAATSMQLSGMKGQLVAGDPTANRQLPTTLNAFQGAMNGSDSIMSSMSSYGWWFMVSIGGIFLSFALFKVVRRYV